MTYLMESPAEGGRLLAQGEASPCRDRLLAAGLDLGSRAVDIGCGSGSTVRTMVDIVGLEGSVVGVDPSLARLDESRALLGAAPNVELLQRGLPQTGLPDAEFDFVWSQYVFEYLEAPELALRELVRIAVPGGKVVVADVDGAGLHFWPTSASLQEGVRRLELALATTGYDLFIGRKLYSLFHDAGLQDIRVRVSPFYVVGGTADARVIADWRQRFEVLAPVATGLFDSEGAYRAFTREYLAMLADPRSFTYAVVLTAEGTKP